MINNSSDYPSIVDALYEGNSIPDVINIYVKTLKETGEQKCISHANTLEFYKSTAINERHLSTIRTLFNKSFKYLYDTVDFDFTMEARRKSLLSTNNKIMKMLAEKKSPDSIRDFLGFRIIVFGNKTEEELTLKCYLLMRTFIEILNNYGYTLCNADAKKGCANNSQTSAIYIPSHVDVTREFGTSYTFGVKDYIQFPKANGYQSLHAVFRDTYGKFFEVQIRTLNQHIRAESGEANHSSYKNATYSDVQKKDFIDKSRIHIPGFAVSPTGETFDYVGLIGSLLIYHRQKTY